jgi:hypothetical protein
MAGGETAAARPSRLGFRSNAGKGRPCVRGGAQVGAREEPGALVVHGHKRSEKLTDGTNGGRWRPVTRGRVQGKEGGFYRPSGASRRLRPSFVSTGASTRARRRLATCGGRRPMEEGGTRSGVCAAAVWHQPRGGRHVTPRRHTVLAEPGLGPAVAGLLRRARPRVWQRG